MIVVDCCRFMSLVNMLDAKHFLAIAGDRERFVEADTSTTGTSVFEDIEESVCRVHC